MLTIPKFLEAGIKALIAQQIACCCAGGGIQITDTVPTEPPGEGDALFQFNTGDSTLYYWHNDTWNAFTGGGGTQVFGVTTDNPPVAVPTGSDPVVLINLTTGIIYYYNAGWLVANDGGTDTNIGNTDQTLTANRLVTLGTFSLIFNGDGAATGFGFNANDTGNGRTSSLAVLPTSIVMQIVDGLNTSSITISQSSVKLNSSLGVYELDTTPVTDESPSIVLGYNTITNRIVAMTKNTASISDVAFAGSWNGDTNVAPSKNAVYDIMITKADDSAVVHNTGPENIGGVKTFTSDPVIPDEAYGAPWNGSLEPPTKNAVYDEMELKADITDLANLKLDQFGITIDGGGSVLSTGTKGYISVPYSGTITGWTILEISATPTPSSSIVVDIWKDTYANYPPTVADAIFTTKPTITTGIKGQNLAPTFVGAGATVTAGDIIGFNIDSVTNAVKVTVLLHITKT